MKTFKQYLAAVALTALACLAVLSLSRADTQTNLSGSMAVSGQGNGYYCIRIQSDDANNFTATTRDVYGYLSSVVITANGNDAAFSVAVKDEHGFTVFNKADCSAASTPYRYAISEVDSVNSDLRAAAVAVAGALTVQVADANDGTTTEVNVYLYTREYWQ